MWKNVALYIVYIVFKTIYERNFWFESHAHIYGPVFLETIYKYVLVKHSNTQNLNAVEIN